MQTWWTGVSLNVNPTCAQSMGSSTGGNRKHGAKLMVGVDFFVIPSTTASA
jgi:hypothetical protein